jgi:hypothetical protein
MSTRVLELESFYYENDRDERAILFEKQRLKLRKVINTPVQPETSASPEYADEELPPFSSQSRRLKDSASSSRKPMSARKDRRSQQLVHSSTAGKKTRVAPIYDWEVRGNTQKAGGEEAPKKSCFEFQVRLSPEEYEELMERRADAGAHGRSYLHKGDGKTMSTVRKKPVEDEEESAFVTSAGPYIEPSSFENWRNINKTKWVAKTDFSCATNKAVQEEEGEFLHDGPYIENAFKTCLRHEDRTRWVGDEFKRNV